VIKCTLPFPNAFGKRITNLEIRNPKQILIFEIQSFKNFVFEFWDCLGFRN